MTSGVPPLNCTLASALHVDDGTNDLIVSQVLRSNELQTWFLSEHLVNVPLVEAEGGNGYESRKPA